MIRKDFRSIRRIAFNILQMEKLNEGNINPVAEMAAMELLEVIASDQPADSHAVYEHLRFNYGEAEK